MTQKKIHKGLDELIETYRTRYPLYQRLCVKLHTLLEDLLSSENIDYQVIEKRTKTVESFAEKIKREGKSYKDPLNEITDFAGLRLILYYTDDVIKVNSLIEKEFSVDKIKSTDKRDILAPDQFGYLSVHKIVKISAFRAKLPEWVSLEKLFAEIQIRTVLQHSWAAISHALQYKHEEDVPEDFKRRLTRLSGLLELADQEFATLRAEQLLLSEQMIEKVQGGDFNIPVNSISIREFSERSNTIKDIYELAIQSGFVPLSKGASVEKGIFQLSVACQMSNISTIELLQKRLVRLKSKVKSFFEEFLRLHDQTHPIVSSYHIAAMTIIGSAKNLTVEAVSQKLEWSERYSENTLQAGKKIKLLR